MLQMRGGEDRALRRGALALAGRDYPLAADPAGGDQSARISARINHLIALQIGEESRSRPAAAVRAL